MEEPLDLSKYHITPFPKGLPKVNTIELARGVRNIQRAIRAMRKDICANCGNPILITIFRGSGYCCDDCRKDIERDRVKAGEEDRSD